jgi:hypothetical protein
VTAHDLIPLETKINFLVSFLRVELASLQAFVSMVVEGRNHFPIFKEKGEPIMKKLSVVVAGTGQIRDIEIQPGTTAGDVLNQLGIKDYLLSKGPNDPFFAAADSIYDKVNDGEKIFASTKADVGEPILCA